MGRKTIHLLSVLIRPRREIRAFWKRLGLFLIFPLLLAAAVETRLAQRPNTFLVKDRELRRQAKTIQILALGSSHTLNGIRPDVFSVPLFNLGNSSQSLVLDDRLLERYLPLLPNLRIVLVVVSYFSLDYLLLKAPESWRESFYQRFYHVGEESGRPWSVWRPAHLSLFYMYGQEAARDGMGEVARGHSVAGLQDNGWLSATERLTSNDADRSGLERTSFLESFIDRRWRLRNVEALYHLINAARARGVAVVFVTLPVHESFARAMNHSRWSSTQWTVRGICRQAHLRYLDHFQTPLLPVADFANSDHLNQKGAFDIGRILNGELALKKHVPSQKL